MRNSSAFPAHRAVLLVVAMVAVLLLGGSAGQEQNDLWSSGD